MRPQQGTDEKYKEDCESSLHVCSIITLSKTLPAGDGCAIVVACNDILDGNGNGP